MRILQIGLGGFGRNHLRAWAELGLAKDLTVVDLQREKALEECTKYNIPPERVVESHRGSLAAADVVDVVTSTDSHYALCAEAVDAGKDVFVEKPMTMTSDEARRLGKLVRERKRILQVGYYYRFHPASLWLRDQIRSGKLGALRYLSGSFMGFKRARTDVGVTHTDAIHFLDLFNWLMEQPPSQVFAVTRDHFHRGLEDFSIVICTYPNGQVAKVESGYIQPGKWMDKVVPSAWTTKEISVVGSQATTEVDFETGEAKLHDVHHELRNGIWAALYNGSSQPAVATAGPMEQICAELTAFLRSVETRESPGANEMASGFYLARLIEAIYGSSQTGQTVQVDYGEEP